MPREIHITLPLSDIVLLVVGVMFFISLDMLSHGARRIPLRYTLLGLGGRGPLCGTGVTSLMD